MSRECPECGSTDTNPGVLDLDTDLTFCSEGCANDYDGSGNIQTREVDDGVVGDDADPVRIGERFPEWCIDRAKELADAHGSDYWWPFLDTVARQNEMLYGRPFPEKDPARESRRQKAVEHQRVLDAGRFVDG